MAHVANKGFPEQLSLHFPRKWRNGEWAQHLLQIIYVGNLSGDFECIPSKLETTSSVLRQWAIKTRPLSNCVLRASAYQSARQRNAGIARKNIAMAFEDYLGKEGCLEDPFSKQILRNYQPCVSTPNNSWTKQRRCQSTKHCLSQILPNIFILQLMRNIPWTIMTLIVFCLEIMQWKENASTLILWTWKGMILKGIFLSNFWDLYML